MILSIVKSIGSLASSYVDGKVQTQKIKKVVKGLSKASKTHASQAKTLKGLLNGKKKRPQSRNRKKT